MAKSQNLTARDIMSKGVKCIGENGNLEEAARMMRDLEVGVVPICGEDNRLKGMITDRDIVVSCCAEGRSPADVRASEFAKEVYWVAADAPVSEVLHKLEEHQIKRIPVIDTKNDKRLVGMISEANLAKNLTDQQLAEFVEKVYATT